MSKQIITRDYQQIVSIAAGHPTTTIKSLNGYIAWAKNNRSKRINRDSSSYGLKHRCEDISDLLNKHEYVSNEDLIIAMVQNGFQAINAEHSGRPGPNYYFNVKSLKNYDLQKIADSIDGGHRYSSSKEKEEKSDDRSEAYRYKNRMKEHFKKNGIEEHIKYTYYYGGKASAFHPTGAPICRVLPDDLFEATREAAAKCQKIYKEIEQDPDSNKWIADWSPQSGLQKLMDVSLHCRNKTTTTMTIGDGKLAITLVGSKKTDYETQNDLRIIFIEGHNENYLDDYEKWLMMFNLKAAK